MTGTAPFRARVPSLQFLLCAVSSVNRPTAVKESGMAGTAPFRARAPSLLFLLCAVSPGSAAARQRSLDSNECGRRLLVGNPTSRIVGGKDVLPGAWPWQVSIQYNAGYIGYVHVCGGSLISSKWVLTAAHCFKKSKDAPMWRAVIGLHTLFSHTAPTRVKKISSIIIKPDYLEATMINDITLLELAKPVVYSDSIQPVCLPNNLEAGSNTPCFISGWGKTSQGGVLSLILQEAQVDILSNALCNETDWYDGIITNDMICAGFEVGGIDSCQGDSGGPFVCYFPEEKIFYQLGITSFGYGCAKPHKPGIYTKVSHYRDWIEKVTSSNKRDYILSLFPVILLTFLKKILF